MSLLSVMSAIRIIEEWVRPNLERVFAGSSMPKAQRDAMTVGRWLLKTKPDDIVNARELRRQPGFPGPKDAKELDEALQILVEARWLEPVPEDRRWRDRKARAHLAAHAAPFLRLLPCRPGHRSAHYAGLSRPPRSQAHSSSHPCCRASFRGTVAMSRAGERPALATLAHANMTQILVGVPHSRCRGASRISPEASPPLILHPL